MSKRWACIAPGPLAADYSCSVRRLPILTLPLLRDTPSQQAPPDASFIRQLTDWAHTGLAKHGVNRSMGMPTRPLVLGNSVLDKRYLNYRVIAPAGRVRP